MTTRPLLLVAMLVVGCGTTAAQKAGAIKSGTDLAVNPTAALMADFAARVDKYAALYKALATGAAAQKENTTAERIGAQQKALAAKMQAARASATHGDIFFPEIRAVFRRLLAPELKGEDGRDAKAVLKDDAPAAGTVAFKVNAMYPEKQPKPAMPANLLQSVPPLPEPLEYRVVGQHLLLLDTATDLIVDYIFNAITP